MPRPLRALIVEDDEADLELLLRELRRGGYDPTYERVQTAEAMRAALESNSWELVLSDFSMPQFSAPDALALLKEMAVDLPFIIVSGTIGEETAVEVMRAGAQDFVVKDKLTRLLPAIERELREAQLRRDRIAERTRAEAERERLLAELREAVQARDTFLAIASHELKTPLTSLQLQVQTLQRADERERLATLPAKKLQAKVHSIARQVARLGALINNLLDVSRITSGRMTLAAERVDLAEVVAGVIAQSQDLIRQSESEVVVEATPVIGYWDRLRIETVVSNLLSNALKFGERSPVVVAVSGDGRLARLVVTDHGIGISPDQQARIFEKFERAVSEQHYGGFGLGLWIVRQIVEAHDGSIRVTSEPGAGSSFVVELPLGPRADP